MYRKQRRHSVPHATPHASSRQRLGSTRPGGRQPEPAACLPHRLFPLRAGQLAGRMGMGCPDPMFLSVPCPRPPPPLLLRAPLANTHPPTHPLPPPTHSPSRGAGWTGGPYGVGRRFKLRHTRAIVDAIHSGELAAAQYDTMPVFNLQVELRIFLRGWGLREVGVRAWLWPAAGSWLRAGAAGRVSWGSGLLARPRSQLGASRCPTLVPRPCTLRVLCAGAHRCERRA